MDYENSTFDNSDFQDNIYLVSNMRPSNQAPAPTDVRAVNSTGGATIQWAPVSDGSLVGYNVYRATSQSGPYTKLDANPFSQTSFTDANPGSGTVYYRVTAVDGAGESLGTNASLAVSAVQPNDQLTSADVNATIPGSSSASISVAPLGSVTHPRGARAPDSPPLARAGFRRDERAPATTSTSRDSLRCSLPGCS